MGYIDEQTFRYLFLRQPIRSQRLYFLKKIHKTPHSIRPIVSGCSGPTEKLSAYMDHHLKPLAMRTKSYIKDSKSLLSLLDNLNLPINVLLVTIDVTALYLNIPHQEGIAAAIYHLYHMNPDYDQVPFPPFVAEKILTFVLDHNYFLFANKVYKQVQGTAMGTKMAPHYATMFLDILENKFLTDRNLKPLIWKRYIDILVLWTHSRTELDEFMQALDALHPTIKFTSSISDQEVVFLDFYIYKGNRFKTEGILDVRPHFKTTNTFQYLHFKSSHPSHTFTAIVKGEVTRILRACSSPEIFKDIKRKLVCHFIARGYPSSLVKRVAHGIPFSRRLSLLYDGARIDNDEDAQTSSAQPSPSHNVKMDFISPYTGFISKSTLSKIFHLPDGLSHLPDTRFVFTRNKTVGDHLVRAQV